MLPLLFILEIFHSDYRGNSNRFPVVHKIMGEWLQMCRLDAYRTDVFPKYLRLRIFAYGKSPV